MAADLPHRLRTPLTALRMNAAALGPGRAADETRLAVDRLEQRGRPDHPRRPPARAGEPSGCDAAEVLADRIGFWSALAEDQGRPCQLTGADRPVRVPVPRSDLAAAADALIGNVFRHTAEGTGFAVTLHRRRRRRAHLLRRRRARHRRPGRRAAPRQQRRAAPPASASTSPAASPSPPAAALKIDPSALGGAAGPAAAAHRLAGAGRHPAIPTSLTAAEQQLAPASPASGLTGLGSTSASASTSPAASPSPPAAH